MEDDNHEHTLIIYHDHLAKTRSNFTSLKPLETKLLAVEHSPNNHRNQWINRNLTINFVNSCQNYRSPYRKIYNQSRRVKMEKKKRTRNQTLN